MRNVIIPVLILLVAPSARTQEGGGPPPPPPTMVQDQLQAPGQDIAIVSGTGIVSMLPDVVTIQLGVETEGADVRKIVDANNARVAQILEELKARGVKPEELQTSSFYLGSVQKDGVRLGYRVSNRITMRSGDVNKAGELIQAAIDSGANEISGPDFSVENEKSVQDRCLDMAFGDARSKASRLAFLANRKLRKVLAVTDGSSSPYTLEHHTGVWGGVPGGVSMETGIHRVRCGVTVVFQLE